MNKMFIPFQIQLYVISRLGQIQDLLYKHGCNSLSNWLWICLVPLGRVCYHWVYPVQVSIQMVDLLIILFSIQLYKKYVTFLWFYSIIKDLLFFFLQVLLHPYIQFATYFTARIEGIQCYQNTDLLKYRVARIQSYQDTVFNTVS